MVLFVVGLGLLVVGAELVVRGASRVATTLGVSPMFIGLTIVSIGASAPELAVGIVAGMQGKAREGWRWETSLARTFSTSCSFWA